MVRELPPAVIGFGQSPLEHERPHRSVEDKNSLPQELVELLPPHLRDRLGSADGQASAARTDDEPPA